MSQKLSSIELFGMPGSGKSYCSNLIKSILKKKGYNIYNAREIIIKNSKRLIKLSISENISLSYYNLINFKNKKLPYKKKENSFTNNKLLKIKKSSNFFKQNYFSVCKKIVMTETKYLPLLNKIGKLFNRNPSLKEKQYQFWIYELLAAKIIFRKYLISRKNNIFLLDEGFVQRSFALNKVLKKKIDKKFFNAFFSKIPLSNKIIFIKTLSKNIGNLNKNRKVSNIKKYKTKNELNEMSCFLSNYLLKQKKFSFLTIENNKNFNIAIKNLFQK